MRIVPDLEGKIRREIRDARARDPLVSVVSLQQELERKFERTFSRKYVAKLAHKIERQALIEADRTKIEQRLNFTRENYRMIRERLLKIVYWEADPDLPPSPQKPPYNEDVIEAAKNLVMMDLAILKAEIDCGIYKKDDLQLVREFRYEPVPGEVRAVIIAAWQRGGLLPKAAIDEMVPTNTTRD